MYEVAPAPRASGCRFTLTELIVVVVFIAVVGAMMLVGILDSVKQGRMTRCGAQLSQLIKACYNYAPWHSPVEGLFQEDTSGQEWVLRLYRAREVEDPEVFWCPGADPPGVGKTTYRGFNQHSPAGTVNQCPGDTPVMADRDSNHGGSLWVDMNYVLKSGSVHHIPRDSPFWRDTISRWVIE